MSCNCGILATLAPFRIAILANAGFIADKDSVGRQMAQITRVHYWACYYRDRVASMNNSWSVVARGWLAGPRITVNPTLICSSGCYFAPVIDKYNIISDCRIVTSPKENEHAFEESQTNQASRKKYTTNRQILWCRNIEICFFLFVHVGTKWHRRGCKLTRESGTRESERGTVFVLGCTDVHRINTAIPYIHTAYVRK